MGWSYSGMPVLGFTALLLLQHFNLSYSQRGLACKSTNFLGNRTYEQCDDLHPLDAYIHWNYIASKSTLEICFAAHPVTSKGWVAWAINPSSEGMIGSQTLVAYLGDDMDKVIVKTYNITSYELSPSKIDFEVLDLETQYTVDGWIKIYATLVLPKDWGTTLNHVWQVGSSVVSGVLMKHGFGPDNMNSMGKLDLVKGESISGATGGEIKHKY
ncbi:hypothetical protein MKW94_027262, partial [Papaver nudicaule]|nr:hypothetical protein [Papaver nudicaule]